MRIGFLGWVAVGALGVFGVLAMLSIGLPFVLAAGILAVVLVRRGALPPCGALSGAGLPLLLIGWLNRGGPGTVCNASGTTCTEAWNPLPWFVAGVVLVLAGLAADTLRDRHVGAEPVSRSGTS